MTGDQAPDAAEQDAEHLEAAARLRGQRPAGSSRGLPRHAAIAPRRCSGHRAAPN